MTSLMNLPFEVLEQILLLLEDVEDVVSLGSTCVLLAGILTQLRIWRIVLAKTEMVEHGEVMEGRLRAMYKFLSSLPESEGIFSFLHKTIYERYPGVQGVNSVTVSFPGDPKHHSVSVLGLQLLVLTDRKTTGHTILQVQLSGGWQTRNWMTLNRLLSLQKEIRELVIEEVACYTEEEGVTMCSLLERCSTWRMDWLHLEGEVGGEAWRRLGRQSARGSLSGVDIGREVVKRGRREDIRAVWGSVQFDWRVDGLGGWVVDGEYIEKTDGDEGWRRIEEMIL